MSEAAAIAVAPAPRPPRLDWQMFGVMVMLAAQLFGGGIWAGTVTTRLANIEDRQMMAQDRLSQRITRLETRIED